MKRADVERAILEEEIALSAVVRLLEQGGRVEAWPEALRRALALALDASGATSSEVWRIVALRRHLFGHEASTPMGLVPAGNPTDVDRRHAERLRADLPARVAYRTGMHLVGR